VSDKQGTRRYFMSHVMEISSAKLVDDDNSFVELRYEGNEQDCVLVVEEMEKAAKRAIRKLSRKKR